MLGEPIICCGYTHQVVKTPFQHPNTLAATHHFLQVVIEARCGPQHIEEVGCGERAEGIVTRDGSIGQAAQVLAKGNHLSHSLAYFAVVATR